MSVSTPTRKSAAVLGAEHGLTATEMNFVLAEEGLLTGRPSEWRLTDQGQQVATVRYASAGPNSSYAVTTFPDSVTDSIVVDPERRQRVADAASAARAQRRAENAARAVDLNADAETPSAHGPTAMQVVGAAAALIAVAYVGRKAFLYVRSRRAKSSVPPSARPDTSST